MKDGKRHMEEETETALEGRADGDSRGSGRKQAYQAWIVAGWDAEISTRWRAERDEKAAWWRGADGS